MQPNQKVVVDGNIKAEVVKVWLDAVEFSDGKTLYKIKHEDLKDRVQFEGEKPKGNPVKTESKPVKTESKPVNKAEA